MSQNYALYIYIYLYVYLYNFRIKYCNLSTPVTRVGISPIKKVEDASANPRTNICPR